MANESPYSKQHTPDKDSLLVPGAIKQAITRQLRRRRLLEEAGLDETKEFKTSAEQAAYMDRIDRVLKGML